MTKFTLLDKEFRNKAEAEKYYLDIFLKNGVFELTDNHKQILFALHNLNPDYKLSAVDYKLVINKYKKVEIHQLLNETDKWEPFSIKTCITGKGKTQLRKVNKKFREAIEPQIMNFRNLHSRCEMYCQICKSTASIQVDHVEPVFHTIVSTFLDNEKLEGDFDITDDILQKFSEYHFDTSRLRLLCQPCNLKEFSKRGRKKTQSIQEHEEWVKRYHRERYQRKKQTSSASDSSSD